MSGRLLAAAVLALAGLAAPVSAQHVAIGPQVVFGEYREVSSDLQFRGIGFGATAVVNWRKLSADVVYSKIRYEPHDNPAATEFDATQIDARLRYYISGPVSAELGFTKREADPEFEAQSVAAVTAGVRMAYLLGPGVWMSLRGGMLFGAKFSGGGTSSPLGAIELGLQVTADALRGRLRLIGNYDFQRIAREANDGSGEVEVPIQQSLGRVGIAVAF